jgi:hypothetical protein
VIAALVLAAGMSVGISTMASAAPAVSGCPDVYEPVGIHSGGEYLDDVGGGSGTYVRSYPYSGSPNQIWCPQVANEGGMYYHPMNNQGLCLDAHSDNSGQQIWVYACNGTAAQRWCWQATTTPTYFVRKTNASEALVDNGWHNIVTISNGASQWAPTMNHYSDSNC